MAGPIRLTVDETVRALAGIPLFAEMPEEGLRDIAEHAHILPFADGAVIIPEGEEGLGFYVVLSGRVRVERGGRLVARLGANEFFGEISLLENTPRGASVVSEGGAVCLGILRSHFKPLLVKNPRLALRILDEEARRRDTGMPLA